MKRIRFLVGILFVIFGGLIIFGLWKFGTILGFFLVYPWVLAWISGKVINPHIANIVALVVTVVLYFVVYRFIWRRNKNYGYACLIGLLILQSGFMFLVEKDRFYSVMSGEPIKYYTINPITSEYQIFDRPIYDAFGQKAVPVTFKIAQEIYRQKHADKYPLEEIPFQKITKFFDSYTGKALVYYCQDTAGKYHFFVHDGYDPVTGKKLQPVTPEVVERCIKDLPENVPKAAVTKPKRGQKIDHENVVILFQNILWDNTLRAQDKSRLLQNLIHRYPNYNLQFKEILLKDSNNLLPQDKSDLLKDLIAVRAKVRFSSMIILGLVILSLVIGGLSVLIYRYYRKRKMSTIRLTRVEGDELKKAEPLFQEILHDTNLESHQKYYLLRNFVSLEPDKVRQILQDPKFREILNDRNLEAYQKYYLLKDLVENFVKNKDPMDFVPETELTHVPTGFSFSKAVGDTIAPSAPYPEIKTPW